MADCILTQARLKELLHYDPDTGVFTNIKARQNVRVGSVTGCVSTTTGYVGIKVDCRKYQAHRLAWLYVHGSFPPEQLDHINRVRTDNRLCNLRLATSIENGQNRSMPRNNTSGHVGVSWSKAKRKWLAEIMLDGKNIRLGLFTDKDQAVKARLEAKSKHHQFHSWD